MQVFNIDHQLLGFCDVHKRRLIGKYFVISIAEKGEYCEECRVFHTIFESIKFDITVTAPCTPALIARDPEDVKFLPGFKHHDGVLSKLRKSINTNQAM